MLIGLRKDFKFLRRKELLQAIKFTTKSSHIFKKLTAFLTTVNLTKNVFHDKFNFIM